MVTTLPLFRKTSNKKGLSQGGESSTMCGKTIETTSCPSSCNVKLNGVAVAKSLCSGNFTPLNKSTNYIIEQIEQRKMETAASSHKDEPVFASSIQVVTKETTKTKKKCFVWLRTKLSSASSKLLHRSSSTMSMSTEEHCYSELSSEQQSFCNNDSSFTKLQVGEEDIDDVGFTDCDSCYGLDQNTVVSLGEQPSVAETEISEIPTLPTVPMHETQDVYGQIHPIENDTLIDQALYIFEQTWKSLPSSKVFEAELAEANCPQLVSILCKEGKDFKLQFIRCEVYRINDAAERYVNYWTRRCELFGAERAFKPITMSSLSDNERTILSNNYLSYLPATQQKELNQLNNDTTSAVPTEQRDIMFVDYSGFIPSTMANNDFCRALWYMTQTILNESIETQKKGLLIIGTAKTTTCANSPSLTFYSRIAVYFKKTLPVRLSGYHVVYPPYYLRFLYPLTCKFLSKNRIKMRLMVHLSVSNDQELLELFQTKYGIVKQQLPTSLGGTYVINEKEWIQNRIQLGK